MSQDMSGDSSLASGRDDTTSELRPEVSAVVRPAPAQTGAASISASELAYLTDVVATDGSFRCRLCGKLFGYKNGLMRHVRLTHMGEKPYECNICRRRFGYKHILMEHQNLHFGNRPYACSMCDKRFAARSNLIQHRLVHKRPYHCTLCGKRFDRDDQLQKHLFAHPQAVLACNGCSYAASSQSDLNRHLLDVHHPRPLVGRAGAADSLTAALVEQGAADGSRPRRPGIDAICSQLSAGSASSTADDDDQPAIKKEKLDDGFDAAARGEDGAATPPGDQQARSSLPGIREAFSHRRSPLNTMLAGYGFASLLTSPTAAQLTSPGATQLTSPGAAQLTSPATAQLTSPPPAVPRAGHVPRPTAQLPPIMQLLSPATRDQATQHAAPVPRLPHLEDVLAYHVQLGTVFRCPHCNIYFMERGMYFLHVSLHGATSPWECAICHRMCADKNEFTLHFVNQEHGGTGA